MIRQLSVDDKSSRSSNITEDIAKEVESDYTSQFMEESNTIKEDIETGSNSKTNNRLKDGKDRNKSYSENFSNGDSLYSDMTSSNTIVRSEKHSTR